MAPADVIAKAAREGVELVALTDHDTVEGVPEAAEAARAHGIRLTPAAEISAVDGVYEDLHVCGYDLDLATPRSTTRSPPIATTASSARSRSPTASRRWASRSTAR